MFVCLRLGWFMSHLASCNWSVTDLKKVMDSLQCSPQFGRFVSTSQPSSPPGQCLGVIRNGAWEHFFSVMCMSVQTSFWFSPFLSGVFNCLWCPVVWMILSQCCMMGDPLSLLFNRLFLHILPFLTQFIIFPFQLSNTGYINGLWHTWYIRCIYVSIVPVRPLPNYKQIYIICVSYVKIICCTVYILRVECIYCLGKLSRLKHEYISHTKEVKKN